MYVVIKVETGKLYFFKGAYKTAEFIGVSEKTIYRHTKNKTYTFTEKEYNGYKFARPLYNPYGNNPRGIPFKKKF